MKAKIIHTKILELLESFSAQEINQFTAFVNSKYHNTDEKLIKLLRCLKKVVAGKAVYQKAYQLKVFKTVFPEKKITASVLKHEELMLLNAKVNLLYKKAKQYLAFELLKNEDESCTSLFLESLSKKKQYRLMQRELNKEKKYLDKVSVKGSDFYTRAIRYESVLLKFYYQNNLIGKKDNLQALNAHLDLRYALDKLSITLTMHSLSRVFPTKEFDMDMDVLELLLKIPLCEKHPLVKVCQQAIRLMEIGGNDHYLELLKLLQDHASAIPTEIQNACYVVAVNFCSRQIRKGNTAYNQFLFELYKLLDKQNLLLEEGHLPLGKLKNMVVMACKVEAYEWAMAIVEKYRPMLNSTFAQSACSFNYGLIAFYQKQYNPALRYLIRAEKTTVAYNVNARLLRLKCHYELDKEYDIETIRIFLNAEHFVRHHKTLSSIEKRAGKNFVRILINIYNKRYGAGKMTVVRIRKKIHTVEYLNDKQWLLEKLEGVGD